MSKVSTKGKEKVLPAVTEPDTDMIVSVEIVEEFPQPSSVPHGIGESSKSPPTASKPSENAADKSAPKLTSLPLKQSVSSSSDQLSKLKNDAPPKQR
ncbi:EKA-like protein [Blumeria hordei DH14]|uniref:EKA-like protein n=1 Tax=Blumeria graminis f. sp. hordei (strain DH14) TaxID=546991 RepID=N1JFG2_BLUG1|nr:EKA-like protein [Blumeria hordei DH14]